MRDLEKVPEALAREPSVPGHAAGTMISPADLVAYANARGRIRAWLGKRA